MPRNDWRYDSNLVEYTDILNEICTLSTNVKLILSVLVGTLALI